MVIDILTYCTENGFWHGVGCLIFIACAGLIAVMCIEAFRPINVIIKNTKESKESKDGK